MAENENTQTLSARTDQISDAPDAGPAQPAPDPVRSWAVPAGDGTPYGAPHAPHGGQHMPSGAQHVPSGAQHGPYGGQDSVPEGAAFPARRGPGFADRLRAPIAGALLGGVVILGAGFAAGYVVGHDRGGSASTDGPGTQVGQFRQGAPGDGQFGQGAPGDGQFGPGRQFGQAGPGGEDGQPLPGRFDDQVDGTS